MVRTSGEAADVSNTVAAPIECAQKPMRAGAKSRAAGTPILADESKAILRVPDELSRQIHPQADFYVVVRGDSMSCVGYRTGDIIAIKRTPDASEGDVNGRQKLIIMTSWS